MIFQFSEILSYILIYLPPSIYTAFSILMLAFGYLIRKNNGYNYGLFFIISAILSITSNVIYFAINYPFLPYTLTYILNLPISSVGIILTLINALFAVFNVVSSIILTLALYHVYKAHKTPRTEPNTN